MSKIGEEFNKCGAVKKNKSLCENKVNGKYGIRCGFHKNYDTKTVRTPTVRTPTVRTPTVRTPTGEEFKKCGAIKENKSLCENKVNRKYGIRCGVHKNYDNKTVKTPTGVLTVGKPDRDTYLLDYIPGMNRNVADIINEYVDDDDMKYTLGEENIVKRNSIEFKFMEHHLNPKNNRSIVPYYRWPDNTINYIKVRELYERIYSGYSIIFDSDNHMNKLLKVFLTNNFRSAKKVVVDTKIESTHITMQFTLDNKVSKTPFESDKKFFKMPYGMRMTYFINQYKDFLELFKSEFKAQGIKNVVYTTNIPGLTDVDNRGKISSGVSSPRPRSPVSVVVSDSDDIVSDDDIDDDLDFQLGLDEPE
jgi:hypothetical protein